MAKPCTPHPIPQAAQLFKRLTANVGVKGQSPLRFLGGLKGGHSLTWENGPLSPRPRAPTLRGEKESSHFEVTPKS